ncbi:glycerophosphoryl diester phosphodiesterase membrane domain-containing protein [Solibacillus silvestris]|uniref:glycerophosphoryl diester phosphodiesterase membrane domain-containing protein n=1 Tax=Solibacillus silvestris TaxID=76853 RepID=UPI003F82300B
MDRIKRVLQLIFRNLYYYRVDYIRSFAILRFVQAFFVLPLFSLIVALIMDTTGVQTITESSLPYLLTHPYTLIGLSIIMFIGIVFIYYELGFLMLLAYHQQRAIPYTWKGLLKRLNQKVVYFLSLQTLFIVVYLLLLIPLISSILPISLFQNLDIPSFIVAELLNTRQGTIFYVVLLLLLGFIGLRLIFTWPFFTINQWMSIYDAMKASWQFSKRKLAEVIGMFALIIAVHWTLLFAALVIAFLPLFLIEKLMPGWGLVAASFTLTLAEGIILLFFSVLQIVFSQLLVMVAFQLTKHKPLIIQEESFRQTIRQWTFIIAVYAFFLASGFNLINLEKSVYKPDTVVVAHRGFAEEAVENTISAIEAANEAGADMVEIDIQQTKDGEFVVFHDKALSRLTNDVSLVSGLTLEELTQKVVIAKGHADKIASFEQVLEVSRALNIKLLIELKTHGFETDDFLQRFIAQLDRHDALDYHYVQSPDLPVMELLEQMEPRIHTGYIYSIAYGKLPDTTADFISIEQSFATNNIQKQVQKQNKELFVWTINDKRDMQQLYEQNVDAVITDHPDKALSIRREFEEQTNFLRRILNKINIIY